jgi:hypothetical protein
MGPVAGAEHRVCILDAEPLPFELARMRYDAIPADWRRTQARDARILHDDGDACSVHLLCYDRNGALASALRVTPIELARDLDGFAPLLGRAESGPPPSVVLSRLVRGETCAGGRSLRALLRFAGAFCTRQGWDVAIGQADLALSSLFENEGWQRRGAVFRDPAAGPQIMLCRNATPLRTSAA